MTAFRIHPQAGFNFDGLLIDNFASAATLQEAA